MFDIIHEYYGKEIIVLPGLKDFIKRKFKSYENYIEYKERWFRFGIQIITVLALIITLVFMYQDNKDENEYYNKSIESLNATINNQKQKIDDPITLEIPKVLDATISKSVDSIIIKNQPSCYILKFEKQPE